MNQITFSRRCKHSDHRGLVLRHHPPDHMAWAGLLWKHHPPDYMACTFSIEVGSAGTICHGRFRVEVPSTIRYAMVGSVFKYHPLDDMPWWV